MIPRSGLKAVISSLLLDVGRPPLKDLAEVVLLHDLDASLVHEFMVAVAEE